MLISGLAVWEPVQRYPLERSKAVHPPPVVLVSSTLIAMVLCRFGPGAAAALGGCRSALACQYGAVIGAGHRGEVHRACSTVEAIVWRVADVTAVA